MSSAFSSALLLFGISLLYGTTGSLDFTQISHTWAKIHCRFFHSCCCWPVSVSKFPQCLFTCGLPMCMKEAPWPSQVIFLLFQKGLCCLFFVSVLYTVFQPLSTTWYNMLFLVCCRYHADRKSVRTPPAEHETVSCFQFHSTSWFHPHRHQRAIGDGQCFRYFLYHDLYFL